MNATLRKRVAHLLALVKFQSGLNTYDMVSRAWRETPPEASTRGAILAPERLAQLSTRPITSLSMDELTELADHIRSVGLTYYQAAALVEAAERTGRFPLPKLGGGWLRWLGRDAQKLTLLYTVWLGNIAAPAYAQLGNYSQAIRLVARFTTRLGSPGYSGVLGAGSRWAEDPERMRLLTLGPALSGLAEFWPSSPFPGGQVAVSRLVRELERLSPLSPCVTIRAAVLGVVSGCPAATFLMRPAAEFAKEGFEQSLQAAFEFFAQRPELLSAAETCTPRKGIRPMKLIQWPEPAPV